MSKVDEIGSIIDEIIEEREKRDKLLERIKRSSPGSVDAVYDSLTHPYSNDPGDVRAYLWLLSQAIQVPILMREVELLNMEVEALRAGLKKKSSPKMSDMELDDKISMKVSEMILSMTRAKESVKSDAEPKEDSGDKVAKLLNGLDAKEEKDNK